MKNLRRVATPLVVITLLLGLSASPSSGGDVDLFPLTVSFACDDDLSVIATFTVVNNSDEVEEIAFAHLEAPIEVDLDFEPVVVAAGGSSSASLDTGENPLNTTFDVDLEFVSQRRLDRQLVAEYECQAPPAAPAADAPAAAAPAAAAQPVEAAPTFTG